jgi:hypothetical protein
MPSLENVSSLAIEMRPLVIGFGMIKKWKIIRRRNVILMNRPFTRIGQV